MAIFNLKSVVDEVVKVEEMFVNDVVAIALEAKDKSIEEVTSLFDTIVNTIEYDIATLEKGLKSIEDELFSLAAKKLTLESNKTTLTTHQADLTTALDSVKATVAKIAPPVVAPEASPAVTNTVIVEVLGAGGSSNT